MLREYIAYEPATGILSWKKRPPRGPLDSVGRRIGTPCKKRGYLLLTFHGAGFLAHRVAWAIFYGEWPTQNVDHRDGDGSNNRIANLRQANQTQNNANMRMNKNNTSGFRGVYPVKDGVWAGCIQVNGRGKHLGRFMSPEEAARAYNRAARAAFGSFARLNNVAEAA